MDWQRRFLIVPSVLTKKERKKESSGLNLNLIGFRCFLTYFALVEIIIKWNVGLLCEKVFTADNSLLQGVFGCFFLCVSAEA